MWAAQPEDMSLLHVLFYIHSAGSLELLFDTEGGAQQDRFSGGSQRLALRMAEELGVGLPVVTRLMSDIYRKVGSDRAGLERMIRRQSLPPAR